MEDFACFTSSYLDIAIENLANEHRLCELGFNVTLFEKGADLGGIWHWNCYPGARVDSNSLIYQFSAREIWEEWTWSERYPSYAEIRKYLAFVDSKWNLSENIQYNSTVVKARFDEDNHQWLITLGTGETVRTRWFISALGFASKLYVPPLPGLENFKGTSFHTAAWPQSGIDVKGKRVAVIGTGASGVQVIQSVAPEVSHLTVYQRTPNLALPMRQVKLNPYNEAELKKNGQYEATLEKLRNNSGGYEFAPLNKNTFDATPEERREYYEMMFAYGGLRFKLGAYKDMMTNQEANDDAYAFWAEKTRPRIQDPVKRDLLAPLKQPHAFGTKRPSLEMNYYEVFNQANVDIVNTSENPVLEITPKGVRTAQGEVEVDILILATGFDTMTGSYTQIDIEGVNGRSIKQEWQTGVHTFLGMAINHFPNMLLMYGPQAPASTANGPTILEWQAEFIGSVVKDLREKGITRLEATPAAEEDWKKRVRDHWYATLHPNTKSWYQGANIPGKPVEPLNWYVLLNTLLPTLNMRARGQQEYQLTKLLDSRAGGLPAYIDFCDNVKETGYPGFATE